MAKRRTFIFDGLGVSPGVAIGPAYVIEPQGVNLESHPIREEDVEGEVQRFIDAVEEAKREVQDLGRQVAEIVDAQQASIFEAHVTLLSDPLLIEKTVRNIRGNRRNAEFVFWTITKEIGEQLKGLGDSYFGERTHDLYDIARRVLKFLERSRGPEDARFPEGAIVVAPDLGPSDTAMLHRERISGFATDTGGPTSHTAIMAKALSLPAVVGLDFITHYVRTGDQLILDGHSGRVIINPTQEQRNYYATVAEDLRKVRLDLEDMKELPAVTLDGVDIRLQANIEFTRELELVLKTGADGIGLFRTEYFFIERKALPSEAEQEEAYRHVLEAMGDREVVFRTLDVGGDKLAINIPLPVEGNPFLGLRALRLCLAHPELFRTQLRPLFRATRGRELNLLLPMVSGIEEVRLARGYIEEVRDEIEREGNGLPETVRLGVMIEIPSAALQADLLAKEADFFSIGTNDLVQYTLAVDRVNKLVGHLYAETHPAVLHLISRIVKAADKSGTPVAVCGEMAGDPAMGLLLIGLGVKTLSMSAAMIAPLKKVIRGVEYQMLRKMADHLLTLSTPEEVREHLNNYLSEHVPSPRSMKSV